MTYSNLDIRSPEEKELDLVALNAIQEHLEDSIAAYALERVENLYDEELSQIVRNLMFSQGTRTYQLVICPDGMIRFTDRRFPIPLLMEIHNALMELVLADQCTE